MDSSSDDFEIDLGDDKSEINDDSSENEASESEEDYQQNNQVEDEDDMPPTQDMLDRQREANIKALVSGSLEIARKPLIPKLLHVDAKLVLHRPFKTPHPDAPNRSEVSLYFTFNHNLRSLYSQPQTFDIHRNLSAIS